MLNKTVVKALEFCEGNFFMFIHQIYNSVFFYRKPRSEVDVLTKVKSLRSVMNSRSKLQVVKSNKLLAQIGRTKYSFRIPVSHNKTQMHFCCSFQ